MLRRFLFAVPLAFAASISSAQTYTAENRVAVQPVANGGFAVSSGGRYGARGAWCAAADYAMNVLGQGGTARLYVQQAVSTSSGTVVFGLDPAGATPLSVSSTSAALRSVGSNLSVDHAIQFCHDARLTNGR